MKVDMSKITDYELVEEFKKRFIVYQWYDKENIEGLCNQDEEISEEKYEAFKNWVMYKSTYHREIDEATQELWDNFNDEEE